MYGTRSRSKLDATHSGLHSQSNTMDMVLLSNDVFGCYHQSVEPIHDTKRSGDPDTEHSSKSVA